MRSLGVALEPVDNNMKPLLPLALIASSSLVEPISMSAFSVPFLLKLSPALPPLSNSISPDTSIPLSFTRSLSVPSTSAVI